jgi:DNA-binding NtrC family response regulator
MHESPTVTSDATASSVETNARPPQALALVVAWSPGEPERIGDVCVVPAPKRETASFTLGRGAAGEDAGEVRLAFARHRPGVFEPRPAIGSSRISRRQLLVRAGAQRLAVQNVGRCPLHHNGQRVEAAEVAPGDTLRVGAELLLVCVRRAAWLAPAEPRASDFAFGAPDAHGFVGESAAAWELRRQLRLVAARAEHVLVVGESGTGKEIAARALHALSPRAASPFCARNAATFPEGVIDAELFGHARNYPNAGMPERPGLLGQAAAGTIFLDELAELPATLQTHLLRVLDDGEYQRLGEASSRVSEARFVGATNRPERLRDDLAARFRLSVRMPGLNERLEDIPLLVQHFLQRISAGGFDGVGRLSIRFVDALLRRRYTTHVRELEALIWKGLLEGDDAAIEPRTADRSPPRTAPPAPEARTDPRKVSARAIEAALIAHEGSLEKTWRALGLASRHVLTRLMAKHGLRRADPSRDARSRTDA